jgi:hypothetical protein
MLSDAPVAYYGEMELSLAYLHQRLDFNPITGIFIWNYWYGGHKRINTWNTRYAGKRAGGVQNGYCIICVDRVRCYAHRLAWLMTFGELSEDVEIDHISRVRSDNRLQNLRIAETYSQQRCNQGLAINNTSGFKGVSRLDDKWRACVVKDHQDHYLGCFDTAEEAARVRDEYTKTLHGEFAYLNDNCG